LGIAQADGQASLWVSVNQKDFLPRLSQTNSKIGTSGCFADTTFLVGYGNNLCIHNFTSFLSKFRYEKKCLLYLS